MTPTTEQLSAVLTPDQPDYLARQDAETEAALDLIYPDWPEREAVEAEGDGEC